MTDNVASHVSEDLQENRVVRFLFEEHGVRGEITHLSEPFKRLIANHNYPDSVKGLLMDMAVAAILMATTLKANGTVTVQMQCGEGPKALRFAFINIDKDLNFYGSASLIEGIDYDNASFRELTGEGGILVISVFPEGGERYQGIINLDHDTFASTVESYFTTSEQLPTSLFIYHDAEKLVAGGLMLQIIPEIEGNKESLEHLTTLSATLTPQELFTLSLHESLRRLFWNDKIRVFEAESTDFKCTCSKERCVNSLKALSDEDLEDLVSEGTGTTLTCHNCGCIYHFTQHELNEILRDKKRVDDGHDVVIEEQ